MILQEIRNFYFSFDFDGFLHLNPFNESFQCHVNRFSLSLTVFHVERVKVGGGAGWNSISNNIENFYFHLILIGFSPNDPYEKFSNSDTSFEYNRSQNDHLSSNIIVYSTLLCPALYCVQHIIVSNKILCPTKYCVYTYPKVHCSPFTCQHAAVVSCCACEAPELIYCDCQIRQPEVLFKIVIDFDLNQEIGSGGQMFAFFQPFKSAMLQLAHHFIDQKLWLDVKCYCFLFRT